MDLYNAHPKHIFDVVDALSKRAVQYPPNVLVYKPKRETAIENASVAYSYGYEMLTWIKQIDISYLLGWNEIVVPVYVEECGKLLGSIEFYLGCADKTAKGCPEVTQFYKESRETFKKKDLVTAMLNDLMFWSETYGFDIDKKAILVDFDQHRAEHIKLLEKQNGVKCA